MTTHLALTLPLGEIDEYTITDTDSCLSEHALFPDQSSAAPGQSASPLPSASSAPQSGQGLQPRVVNYPYRPIGTAVQRESACSMRIILPAHVDEYKYYERDLNLF